MMLMPEQLANLRRLDVLWDTVPPEAVNLDYVDCGAHACLAGWAARGALLFHDPLEQGYEYSDLDNWLLRVFGSTLGDPLFATRDRYWDESGPDSDWDIAKDRLRRAIEGTP